MINRNHHRLLYFLVLFIGINLYSSSMTAQVRMQYVDYLCGKINEDDVSKISVTHLLPVTIEFIYKAKVVNEKGKEVLVLESNIISCERGRTDYAEEKINSLRVLKKEIDLSTYTGKLTFYAQIVHPQDTSSIIATAEKTLILKEGISMTMEGKVLTDPRLFRMDIVIRHEEKFELKDVFDKMFFQNDNLNTHCTDLEFAIYQANKQIYKGSFTALCLKPGENNLTEAQQARVTIVLDEYGSRDPNIPIQLHFSYGKNSGSGSRTIEALYHTKHSMEYERYTNQSIGLSFVFVGYAENSSLPDPSELIVIFDKTGEVEEVAQGSFSRPESNYLSINDPMGYALRRSDYNGALILQILDSDNFTMEQWLAFIAFSNGIERSDLTTFQSNGLEIIAPKQMLNSITNPSSHREYGSNTFAIKDGEKLILFQVAFITKTATTLDRTIAKDTVNVSRVLNSIIYNNLKFHFQFNDLGKLEELELVPLGMLKDLQARIYSNLDSLISQQQIKETSIIPRFKVITPEQDSIRKYENFHWDSLRISFSHRVDGTIFAPTVSKWPENYFYQKKDKIEYWSQASAPEPSKEILKKYKNYIRISPLSLLHHPVFGQFIRISRIVNTVEDEQLLKAVVGYENSNQFTEAPPIKVIKTKGWKIYASESLINQGRSMVNSNVVWIDSGSFLYRIKISGGFKSDILHLLNSLKIEGKQFHFQYNDVYKLEMIEII